MVTPAAFKDSLTRSAPPDDMGGALQALWWAAKGDWDRAHKLVMGADGRDAAWVHAYLHRVEGDIGNARYWYGRAGHPPHTGAHEEEWAAIAADLLARD